MMKIVKCLDCQDGCNSSEGIFICFQIKSNFWFKDILNREPECEFFKQIEDIGDRWEVTNPIYEGKERW